MKSSLERLQVLLNHKENNPFDVIRIDTGEKAYSGKGNNFCDVRHFVNIYYCCNTGDNNNRDGSLKDNEKKLLDRIKNDEAVLIMAKYDTLDKFKGAFSREMHWINQTYKRQEYFEAISKKLFNHICKIVTKVGGLDKYVEIHFDTLAKMLPVSDHKIYLEGMNMSQVLEAIQSGKVTAKEAEPLLKRLESDERERNSNKLCPFSGSGREPEIPKRICSRTSDPKRLGDCGSCRVAADWEEAYG